jgi:hypothetical protein
MRSVLDSGARWGAPEGPSDADCRNRDQVITEVTAGAGALLVGLEVTGTLAAGEAGGVTERWLVLTVRGDRIADIRGFDDRAAAAVRAGVPA